MEFHIRLQPKRPILLHRLSKKLDLKELYVVAPMTYPSLILDPVIERITSQA